MNEALNVAFAFASIVPLIIAGAVLALYDRDRDEHEPNDQDL